MEVTPIGWALLILGPALMVVRPRWLYVAAIFSLPFTAAEVANVGSGLDSAGVQTSMFLGSLLILSRGISILWKTRIWLPHKGRASIIWLGLFIAVTGLSLVMPLWIDGHVQVPAEVVTDLSSTPLYLRSRNITSVLYMVFGFAFAYLIAETNQRPGMLRLTLKSFFAGSAFSALWGLMEFACKISGIEYPAMIFNNGTGISKLGYTSLFLAEGVPRLSSVSVEPSIFAQTLLVALSLYLPFVFGELRIFGKVMDRLLFTLMLVVLCLTSSSTAYIGIFIILLLVFALFGIRGVLRPRHVTVPLAGLGAAALLYASVPIVRQGLDAILFSKSEDASAVERLITISNSYEMFLKYPVLGIGWGSITSHDLIFNILANAGLLGLLTFTVAMYSIFRSLYHSIKSRRKSLGIAGSMRMDFAVYVALGVALATSAVSGFLNTFSFFWFVVGLAIAGSDAKDFSMNSLQESLYCRPPFKLGARKPSISPRPC